MVVWVLMFVALACGFASAFYVSQLVAARRLRRHRRHMAKHPGTSGARLRSRSLPDALVLYAEQVSRELSVRPDASLLYLIRRKVVVGEKSVAFVEEHGKASGCASRITPAGYVEVRFRLACLTGLAGLLLGSMFSFPLAIVLGCAGIVCGLRILPYIILERERQRASEAQRNISQMLEVIALGMRSGLTFDRSFGLYCDHFGSSFALDCASSYRSWSLGLTSREEALRSLGESYRCEELASAISAIVRSLRFGASFSENLEEMAAQSRRNHRAAVAEKVAKAPVKMMLPTGTLILPAMLLLVLGPVILEFVQGF